MSYKDVEREHADRQAQSVLERDVDLTVSGSDGVQPSLRAPYAFAETILRDALRDRERKSLVLDFACGQGSHSIYPARAGAVVIGLDIAQSALLVARRRAQTASVAESILLCASDGESTCLKESSVDIVIAIHALPPLDIAKACAEVSRVLKPNGVAIFVETLGSNPLFNANRRRNARHSIRTARQAAGVLKLRDLGGLRQSFEDVTWTFFDVTTVALAAVRQTKVSPRTVRVLQRVDRVITRLFPALAFKAVGVATSPR